MVEMVKERPARRLSVDHAKVAVENRQARSATALKGLEGAGMQNLVLTIQARGFDALETLDNVAEVINGLDSDKQEKIWKRLEADPNHAVEDLIKDVTTE